jgi:hypothetical protein
MKSELTGERAIPVPFWGIDGLEGRAERKEPREEDLESGREEECKELDMHGQYGYQNDRDGALVHQK